jgi:8-oxo-dGTP diphosphatase
VKAVVAELVVVAVRERRLEVLLVRLPGSVWALPGTPVPAGVPLEAAARAALAEQTGVREIALEQLYTFDRGQGAGIAVTYLALVAAERHALTPGAQVVEVRWFPVRDLPALGADAERVLEYGHRRLRAKAAYAPIAVQLLPEVFTLGELQDAYEAVLERALDPRNFRRDVLAAGVVAPVGRVRGSGPGRPARLYRAAGGDFQVLARERRIARVIAGTSARGGEGE